MKYARFFHQLVTGFARPSTSPARCPTLTGIALTALLATPVVAADTIKLGLNYPSTGRYKEQGIAQAQGALLAIEEINAQGGVLGQPLELLTANSASDPEKAIENVNSLADQGAAMLFGGASSAVAIAAGKEAAKRKLIYFGTLTYANETTGADGHRYMFREPYSAWMAAKALSRYINANLAGKKMFYATADYNWGNSTEYSLRTLTNSSDTSAHPGLKVKYPKPRRSDLNDALIAAEKSGAEVLVLVQFGEDLATALNIANKMGLKDKMQIIAPNLTLGMARLAGAESLEGVVGAIPWSWNVPYQYDYAAGKQFVETYVQHYGNYPSSSAASAYNIVHQFKSAAERSGSLDSGKLIAALEGHSYTGLKDQQSWRAFDHQNIQTVYVVKGRLREQVLADKMREDYFEIIDTVSGSEAARSHEEWSQARKVAGQPATLQ